MPYCHAVRVRYGECDMQGVVFNAHYLAYCDDATDTWFRTVLGAAYGDRIDIMVKKVVIEWQAGLRFGEPAELDCAVSRWGTTSFDVGIVGGVHGAPRFSATITYVCVQPGTTETMRVPDDIRDALAAAA